MSCNNEDLIRREDAVRSIRADDAWIGITNAEMAFESVNRCETVGDVVEVVRCEKCRYSAESAMLFTDNKKHYMCCNEKNGSIFSHYHDGNHFCGYGERKDGAKCVT